MSSRGGGGPPFPPAGMIFGIRSRLPWSLILLPVLLSAACSNSSTPLKPPLTSVGYIHLPREVGPKASIDLLSLDERVGRLYVPHSSNNALDVIDVKTDKLIGSVPGLLGVKAAALTPNPDVVYTSDGGDGTVGVVDVKALKVLKLIRTSGSPDAIAYDPVHDVVVVSLGSAQKLLFIDRTSERPVGSVTLPGTPELMTVDPTGGNVFVAIHSTDEVDVVDDVSQQITTALKGCAIHQPTGVAFDPDQNRLFVADHLVMSVIDVLLDRCLGSVDIGTGTDQVALNTHTHHLLAANAGSRNISVIDTVSLQPLGIAGTAKQAGSVAVDPTTDRVYVAFPLNGSIAILHDP
jgi:DNA-binding beta-propeller fold protein YncE